MPLQPFVGILGTKRAAHLLRRATFGGTKEEIDQFASLTVSEAISRLFPGEVLNPVMPLDPGTGEEWVTRESAEEDDTLQEYFKGWFIRQMLSAGVSQELRLPFAAREKITLFFHTHFTTKQSKVNNSRSLYYQNQLFRQFSLDKDQGEVINFNPHYS